jgi:dihydroflavonol-4-reductase
VKEGHKVRTTVRNLDDKAKIASIKNAAKDAKNPIEFFQADLLKPETWPVAVKNCDIVMHVASPFPSAPPKDETELIKPAVDGKLINFQKYFFLGV